MWKDTDELQRGDSGLTMRLQGRITGVIHTAEIFTVFILIGQS